MGCWPSSKRFPVTWGNNGDRRHLLVCSFPDTGEVARFWLVQLSKRLGSHCTIYGQANAWAKRNVCYIRLCNSATEQCYKLPLGSIWQLAFKSQLEWFCRKALHFLWMLTTLRTHWASLSPRRNLFSLSWHEEEIDALKSLKHTLQMSTTSILCTVVAMRGQSTVTWYAFL